MAEPSSSTDQPWPKLYREVFTYILPAPSSLQEVLPELYSRTPSETAAGWSAVFDVPPHQMLLYFKEDAGLIERLLTGVRAGTENLGDQQILPPGMYLKRWHGNLSGEHDLRRRDDQQAHVYSIGDLAQLAGFAASVPLGTSVIALKTAHTSVAGQISGANFSFEEFEEVLTNKIFAWFAVEYSSPTVLQTKGKNGPQIWARTVAKPLPKVHRLRDVNHICFDLALQMMGLQGDRTWCMNSPNGGESLFSLVYGGTCFAVAELIRDHAGRLSMLFSPVFSTFTSAANTPPESPLIAIILAISMANAGLITVAAAAGDPPAWTEADSQGGDRTQDGEIEARVRLTGDEPSTRVASGPGQRVMTTVDGEFDLHALCTGEVAAIKYADPTFDEVYPNRVLSLSFSASCLTPRDGKDTHRPSQLSDDVRLYLASQQEQLQYPRALLLPTATESASTIEIQLLGRSDMHSAPFVAKSVPYEFTEAVVRETLFYAEVFPQLAPDIQALVPAWFGTFAPDSGGWYLILLEDTGRTFSDDEGDIHGADEGLARLLQVGIEHWDQRQQNFTKDNTGRTRIIDFGMALLTDNFL